MKSGFSGLGKMRGCDEICIGYEQRVKEKMKVG